MGIPQHSEDEMFSAALLRAIDARARVEKSEASMELEDASDEGNAAASAAALVWLTPEQVRATDAVYMAAIGGYAELVGQHAPYGYEANPDLARLKTSLAQAVARGHKEAAQKLLAIHGFAGEPGAWLREHR